MLSNEVDALGGKWLEILTELYSDEDAVQAKDLQFRLFEATDKALFKEMFENQKGDFADKPAINEILVEGN